MLETLKKWGTDLTLKVKDLFTSPESQVYVKDLRKVMVYKDGRKCRYPKNYDEIVKSGKIIEAKNSEGETIYKLLYGKTDTDGRKPSFELTLVNFCCWNFRFSNFVCCRLRVKKRKNCAYCNNCYDYRYAKNKCSFLI